MVNGRAWSSDELGEIARLLREDGCIARLAERLDRSPNAILIKAQQVVQQGERVPLTLVARA